MVIFVDVILKEISQKGRDYPWAKPEICPRCRASHLWGHGFVPAYLEGCSEAVLLRRYRCPLCRCVIRLRPGGFFARFQVSIQTMRSRLSHRLKTGRWPPGLSRSRQGHWLRGLRRKIKAYLGNGWDQALISAFDHFLHEGKIPVSRAI